MPWATFPRLAQDSSPRLICEANHSSRALGAPALGDVAAARADFVAATELEGQSLFSLRGSHHARHHLDLGDLIAARALGGHGMAKAREHGWNNDLPRFAALLARIDLAEGGDPTPHL